MVRSSLRSLLTKEMISRLHTPTYSSLRQTQISWPATLSRSAPSVSLTLLFGFCSTSFASVSTRTQALNSDDR